MSQFSSDEFLNSFLEEAYEYLRIIQDGLLILEHSFQVRNSKRKRKPTGMDPDEDAPARINELLRALHSLKGISGMVGLTPAADLCHAMEANLKPIQQGRQETTIAVVDKLIEAAKRLEQVVQTVRDPALEMPPVGEMILQLEALSPATASSRDIPNSLHTPAGDAALEIPASKIDQLQGEVHTSLPTEVAAYVKEPEWKKIRASFDAGEIVALATYQPTQEQIGAGKNVNYVRQTIARQANLIKAVPIIEGGAVRFVFIVACKALPPSAELAFLAWEQIKDEPIHPENPQPDIPPLRAGGGAALPGPISIRVDLSRMDVLLQLVGDLVVTRSRISDLVPQLNGAPPPALESLEESINRMERQVRHLREAVMRVRLVPLSEVFARMPLAVRDLARSSGKNIRLIIEGGETEIDKALVERLSEPLMHLIRNSAAHGIELPAQRDAAGKPVEGTIYLSGRTQGDRVVVTVEDDGAGVQVEKVRARAQALGWLQDGQLLSNQEILDLLCRPDFSTLEIADLGAGRGMGMNIVNETIVSLGGELSLENTPGRGAKFILRLPLTLTIIEAFIIEVCGERYAVPQSMVDEVIEASMDAIIHVGHQELLPYRGGAIPLVSLQKRYHLPPSSQGSARWIGLVVGNQERRAAVLVDRVLGVRETVVRPLSDPLITEPSIIGATELGDGSIALILDCHELINESSSASPAHPNGQGARR